ncbi:hypothetical protein [Nitrosopumilus sp.]|uniref:hypothetical protein n=1 Tax=Nitrosopumilus sp. TaxID=2024843 RepID=UPI00292D6DB3|nr:hypothetical protein [Nitrosopumilus sp.]
MPNTKIMTPDQMIKSIILFLIRGTSLSNKSKHMQKNSKPKKKKSNESVHTTETQSNNNIMLRILSQIESLYKKKESTENLSNKNKNYSIKVQLTSENMLNIIPLKTKQKNNSIEKLLGSLTTSKKNLSDLNNCDFL